MSSCSLVIKQMMFKEMPYIKVTALIFASTCGIRSWLLFWGLLGSLKSLMGVEKCYS